MSREISREAKREVSREPRMKSRGKITRKMTRDGLVERNAATGVDVLVSTREAEIDLSTGKRTNNTFLQLDKRPDGSMERIRKRAQQRSLSRQSGSDDAHRRQFHDAGLLGEIQRFQAFGDGGAAVV